VSPYNPLLNLFPFPSWSSISKRSWIVRKAFGTLSLAALLAVFGCSGGPSTAPTGRTTSLAPTDGTKPTATNSSAKPTATNGSGKPTAADSGGAITPENTKIDFHAAAPPPPPKHEHDGGFKKFSGSVKPIADGDITKAKINIEIDIDSIWTDDDGKRNMLTSHLKSPDFFDAKKYPKATFVSKEIKAEKKDDTTHVITGDLTLHGVTKSVTIPAKVTTTDDSVTIDGKFTIDRKEFDFDKKFLAPKVNNEVPVKVLAKVPRK
jgi:polyisoprenoid-binding protein YceI